VKKEGHPEYHPVCFVDVSTSRKFLTRSTMRSKQKETIDGVEYNVVVRDVTSDEKRFLDSAGRVEKFKTKFQRARIK